MACEYCTYDEKPTPVFYHGIKYPVAYVEDDWLVIAMRKPWYSRRAERLTSPINFCPMCGRDLREKLGGDD